MNPIWQVEQGRFKAVADDLGGTTFEIRQGEVTFTVRVGEMEFARFVEQCHGEIEAIEERAEKCRRTGSVEG